MAKYYMGIDIGTSSVKMICLSYDLKHKIKFKSGYNENSINAWRKSLKNVINEAFKLIKNDDIISLSFSSQVGTYILDDGNVISWQSESGKEELCYIKNNVTEKEFIEEISFVHPDLISYPLPRLLYVKKHFPKVKKVMMPKEYFINELTGNFVTDTYSQRGIANLKTNKYTEKLCKRFNLDFELPPIKKVTDVAGYVTEKAEKEYGLKKGTPVILGCNDFYAGLLGAGVMDAGTFFDISGTSEHVGKITENLVSGVISTGYFNGNVSYGVTKSSGKACDFALKNFPPVSCGISEILKHNPPVFLPYMCGGRAPVYNDNARGVFFGISDVTTQEDMAYAIYEGVVFSLYDIGRDINEDNDNGLMICGGGSAVNDLMTEIKSELFNKKVLNVLENDTSALGACIISAYATGKFSDLGDLLKKVVIYKDVKDINNNDREKLLKRFELYKSVYKNLQKDFIKFREI